MAAKTSEWLPGPTVCRCCLSEGCYKDISTEYFWMGKREVYAEMLTETFDINIAYSKSGGPNSNSRLICEPCIARLRDASEFKRQVQECEKTFMQHLDPGTSAAKDVQCEVDSVADEKEVKLEQVKLEKRLSDDDFDDRAFADDDDDDLDDQPLTKLASKVPKKESVDLLDLLDNAKITAKRKSSSKLKSSPAKKAKSSKKDLVKASASKIAKPEKKKKDEFSITRKNAKIIVEYSTAYPFRLPEDNNLVCVYCYDESFDDPSLYREHMSQEHETFKVDVAFAHAHRCDMKVDCSDLRCRICDEAFDSLEDIAKHLHGVHEFAIDLDYDLGLQPFKFSKEKLQCAICNTKFFTLRSLSRHMNTHFAKYTCEACGKSYHTKSSLQHHMTFSSHKDNVSICSRCKKAFTSIAAKREHLRQSNSCCPYVCHICSTRYPTWNIKANHMIEVHGATRKTYPCIECGIVFTRRDNLRAHFKINHTDDYVQCSYCGQKFDSEYNLKKHIVVHTGDKDYSCKHCSKSFGRMNSLRQHMWIHSEIKKHTCEVCNKHFNQRVSWRTHMKSYHPELYELDN